MNFHSKEYRRSRSSYIIQSVFEYFLTILVADAFLAKLLTHIGISDSIIGIISSFVNIAFVFQICSLFIVRLKVKSKNFLIFTYICSFSAFMLMFLVPFMPVKKSGAAAIVIMCVLLGYSLLYVGASIMFRWANSYVEPGRRARFSATREIVSLLSGIAFSALMGFVIDKYEGLGNLQGGLLFIAVCILVLNVCNLICMFLIKGEEKEEISEKHVTIRHTLKYISGNRNLKNVILMTILCEFARYFTVGFVGVFKTNDLQLSVFTIQLINILSNFTRMILTRPLGKYSDKYSFVKGYRIGLYLLGASFFINAFTMPSTWYLVIFHTILYMSSLAGTNMNSFNITYNYVDSQYITQAMAIKNCIGGLFGFAASLLGGKLLDVIQVNGNNVFGIHIYGQQLLSAISFCLILVTIIFNKYVIEKQEVIKQ